MLYIVLFLHQTTTLLVTTECQLCCISYYSYIKPQRSRLSVALRTVVYRTIPTSNHNYGKSVGTFTELYIVLFLHQTTTIQILLRLVIRLYIVLFLHQTTTVGIDRQLLKSCISYYSYIKPQLLTCLVMVIFVVYRTIPTSNHN